MGPSRGRLVFLLVMAVATVVGLVGSSVPAGAAGGGSANGPGTNIGNARPLTGTVSGSLSSALADDWYVIYPATKGGSVTLKITNTLAANSQSCSALLVNIQDSDGNTLRSDTLGPNNSDSSPFSRSLSDRYFVELTTAACDPPTGHPVTYTVSPQAGVGSVPAQPASGSVEPGGSIGDAWPALVGATSYTGTVTNGTVEDWYSLDKKADNDPATIRVENTTTKGSTSCATVLVNLDDADGNTTQSATLGDNHAVTMAIAAAGRYYLELTDGSCAAGGSTYRIEPEPSGEWGSPDQPPVEALPTGSTEAQAGGPLSAGVGYTSTLLSGSAVQWTKFEPDGSTPQVTVSVQDTTDNQSDCQTLLVNLYDAAGNALASATLGDDHGHEFVVDTTGVFYLELDDGHCDPGSTPPTTFEITLNGGVTGAGPSPSPTTTPTASESPSPSPSSSPSGSPSSSPTPTATPTPTPSPTSAAYVALGDSYSSGEGDGDYYPGTATSSDKCHRSRNAYPALLARALGIAMFSGAVGPENAFAACSGAVAQDFSQPNHGRALDPSINRLEGAQQAHLLSGAGGPTNPNLRLVTLTFGGNDMDFPLVVKACSMHGLIERYHLDVGSKFKKLLHKLGGRKDVVEGEGALSHSCEADFTEGLPNPYYDRERPQTPDNPASFPKISGLFERTLAQLKALYARVATDAPNARVLVLGYPSFFPAHPSSDYCDGAVTRSDAQWVAGEIAESDRKIEAAVRSVAPGHPNVEYVSPSDAGSDWTTHSICATAKRTWFVRLNVLRTVALTAAHGHAKPLFRFFESLSEPATSLSMYFHPNVKGQSQLEQAMLVHLR